MEELAYGRNPEGPRGFRAELEAIEAGCADELAGAGLELLRDPARRRELIERLAARASLPGLAIAVDDPGFRQLEDDDEHVLIAYGYAGDPRYLQLLDVEVATQAVVRPVYLAAGKLYVKVRKKTEAGPEKGTVIVRNARSTVMHLVGAYNEQVKQPSETARKLIARRLDALADRIVHEHTPDAAIEDLRRMGLREER